MSEHHKDLEKDSAKLVTETVELHTQIDQIYEENQKLKCDIFAIEKENSELKETISRLIKGKQGLDQVLSIPVNFQKEGLGYTLNKKNVPKTKTPILFVKATNSPSTSHPPLRNAPKIAPKIMNKSVIEPPPRPLKQFFQRRSQNFNSPYPQPLRKFFQSRWKLHISHRGPYYPPMRH